MKDVSNMKFDPMQELAAKLISTRQGLVADLNELTDKVVTNESFAAMLEKRPEDAVHLSRVIALAVIGRYYHDLMKDCTRKEEYALMTNAFRDFIRKKNEVYEEADAENT